MLILFNHNIIMTDEIKLEPGWFIEKGCVCYFFSDYPTTYRIPMERYKIGQKMMDCYKIPPKEYVESIKTSLDDISKEIQPIYSEITKLEKKLRLLREKVVNLNTKKVNIIRGICSEHGHKWKRCINYEDAPENDGLFLVCKRCNKRHACRTEIAAAAAATEAAVATDGDPWKNDEDNNSNYDDWNSNYEIE
jgi:hypothetical protein